jgi:hypothetical protein
MWSCIPRFDKDLIFEYRVFFIERPSNRFIKSKKSGCRCQQEASANIGFYQNKSFILCPQGDITASETGHTIPMQRILCGEQAMSIKNLIYHVYLDKFFTS